VSVKNFRDLKRLYPFTQRARTLGRDTAVLLLSLFSKIDSSGEWVRFPYYHHVFDDEADGFRRQLRYMKRYGDFISLDDAVDIFESNKRIGGRYFCVTFDDGFKNCLTNALPILVENSCKAAFFICTDFIGSRGDDAAADFFSKSADAYPVPVEFLDWDDCRRLVGAGMVIGSHTCSHARLSSLDEKTLRTELEESKERIEKELGVDCIHFCCPWGKPGKDFMSDRGPRIAKELGYHSFLTTERGPNSGDADPFGIRRDDMMAGWGDYQLRYFFSRASNSTR